ncbi:tetratricopeptide repeat protein [Streptomyces xiamenensis]
MSEDRMAHELISAMMAIGDDIGPGARKELGMILGWAAADDPEPADARTHDGNGMSRDQADRLARQLLRRAAEDPELAEMLQRWQLSHTKRPDSPTGTERDSDHRNVVDGVTQVAGSLLQARIVHGGVHLHHHPSRQYPVPRQLPPVSAHFVDRQQDLAELDRQRESHPRFTPQIIVINGQAGVGKTTLAARWLTGLSGAFPDGQLYADLGGYGPSGPARMSDVLEHFLRSLGATVVPALTSEKVALWRSLTADVTLAVLLDNAFTAAQVRPLIPSNPDSLALVTSRRRLAALAMDGATLHQVSVLDSAAAVELLSRGGGGSRVAGDLRAARDVVRLCAHLPLAVSLAAAQLAARPQQPVAAMATTLARGQGPLESLQLDGEAAVRTALDESYHTLPRATALAYRCMGVLPATSFSTELVAACCGIPRDEADEILNGMVEASLLAEDPASGGYRFHDLVHLHAEQRGRDGDAEWLETTTRRFVDWCLYTATRAEELLSPTHRTLARDYRYRPTTPSPFQEADEALHWLDVHRSVLMGAVRHSEAVGWDEACWQLVDAMWPLFLRRRPAEMWVEAHKIGLAAAERTGDRRARARMLTSGGNGWRNIHRPDEAMVWYRQALRQAKEDEDPRQQAQALIGLGNAYLMTGRLEEAEEYLSASLTLRESIGYRRGAALARICLGELELTRGRVGSALRYLRRAHTDLSAERDSYDAARALALLGQADAADGDLAGGIDRLHQAHRAFQETGSPHWQARSLEMIGQVVREQGDNEAARQWYERAHTLYLALSPRDAERLEGRLREL